MEVRWMMAYFDGLFDVVVGVVDWMCCLCNVLIYLLMLMFGAVDLLLALCFVNWI